MRNTEIIEKTREILSEKQEKGRSAWVRGVATYALDLLDLIEVIDKEPGPGRPFDLNNFAEVKKEALCGCDDWRTWLRRGYCRMPDGLVAQRLCAPWELAKTARGTKPPNSRETWLDVAARAVYQAWDLLCDTLEQVTQSLDEWTVTWRGETVRAVAYDCMAAYNPLCIAPLPDTDDMSEQVLVWDYSNNNPRVHKVFWSLRGDPYIVSCKKRYRFDRFLRLDSPWGPEASF